MMRRLSSLAITVILAAAALPDSVSAHEGGEFGFQHRFDARFTGFRAEWDRNWQRSEYVALLNYRWRSRDWNLGDGWRFGPLPVSTVAQPQPESVSVPEPGVWLLLLTGVLGMGPLVWRRREDSLS